MNAERLIAWVEKNRFGIPTGVSIALFLAFIRSAAELFLFSSPSTLADGLLTFSFLMTFWVTTFLGGILILSHFSRAGRRTCFNVTTIGFALILIPIFIDAHGGYTSTFLTISKPRIAMGVLVELPIIFSLASAYVFIKTKSIARALGTLASLTIFGAILGAPPHPIFMKYSVYDFLVYYIFLGSIVAYLVFFREARGTFRPMRGAHFLLMVFIGVLIAGNVSPALALALVVAAAVWHYSTLVNDSCDYEIDKDLGKRRPLVTGELMGEDYKRAIYVSLAISMVGSLALGVEPFLIVLASLVLGYLYSTPPVRLKRFIFGSAVVGLGSLLMFTLGLTVTSGLYLRPLSLYELKIGLIIFATFSVAPMTLDLKDWAGDQKHGVSTIYSRLGFVRGKKVVTALLFLLFLSPLLIIPGIIELLVLMGAGALACAAFYLKERIDLLFLIYFATLIFIITALVLSQKVP